MASEPASDRPGAELEEEQRLIEEACRGNLDAMRPILERYAQPLCGFRQSPRQPFVVHPMIAAHEESPPDGWRESGDSLVDRLRRQTFERQALARLAAADLLEFPAVLVIGGHHQDSVATVAHGLAAQLLDFLDKARVKVTAGRAQLEEGVEVDHLALGCDHPRGRAARLAPGFAALEHDDFQMSLRQAKRYRAADHTAAEDNHVRSGR